MAGAAITLAWTAAMARTRTKAKIKYFILLVV
jgi:hypothetical protein